MRIVIAGTGEVGSHLAKLLSREAQDVIVIDRDEAHLDFLDSKYNLLTVCGSPTSFRILQEANAGKCDLFIAVTPFETDNITACAIAKSMGAKKTVARVDNFEYMKDQHLDFFQSLGVDSVIYPEYYAAREILDALSHTWTRHWFEMWNGELILIGVKLRDNAQIVGMKLRELGALSRNFHVSAIRRRHDTIIPGGDDIIKVGDIVYFMTKADNVDELRRVCGKGEMIVRNVMILGGGRIAGRLCSMAGGKYKFKIINDDGDQCLKLAERCPEADVVCGDGRDNDLLADEGISSFDAFLALTDSAESNILACLTAKEFGVEKTIAEVENIQYIGEAEALNIGTIVNKKLLAAGAIFQRLLDLDSTNSKCLALADAEVAEIEVKEGSKITRAAVKDLNLSHDMTIAGLIRDGKGQLVGGNTVIHGGDRVVVFCLTGAIHKFEKLFN